MISLPRSLSPNPSRKEASRQQDHREEDFGVNPPTPGRARPGSLPPAAPPRLPAGSAHLAPHVPVPVAIAVAVAVPVADSALRQPYLCPTSQRAREAERSGAGRGGTGRDGAAGEVGAEAEGREKGREGKERKKGGRRRAGGPQRGWS